MAGVIWMPRALRELEEIWLFIARDSETYADVVTNRISQAALRLPDFPAVGRVVPEVDRQDTRELLVGQYRLLYRLNDDDVGITRLSTAPGKSGRRACHCKTIRQRQYLYGATSS